MPLVSVKKLNNGIPYDLSSETLPLDSLQRIHLAAAGALLRAAADIPKEAHPAVADALLANYQEQALIQQGIALLKEVACTMDPAVNKAIRPEDAIKLFDPVEAAEVFYAIGWKKRPAEKLAVAPVAQEAAEQARP